MDGRYALRVLVVGATGNVGTALVPKLLDDVDEVLGLARRTPARGHPGVRWVEADIERSPLRPLLQGVDAVVHLAWLIQPSRRPSGTWDVNVRGTERLLASVADSDVRAFVYASSIGAYSPGPKDRPVDESWPTNGIPTSAYSREKAYVERLLDRFELERPETRVVRLRPALIFQRAAASEIRRFFLGSLFLNQLARPSRVPVFPRVRGLRFQAVHADDVADAYRRAVVGDVRGAFNIAADPVLDLASVADVLRARTIPVPRPLIRPLAHATWRLRLHPVSPDWVDLAFQSPVLDPTRARAELGWRPERSSTAAVAELLGGIADEAGAQTPTLRPDEDVSRLHELATGQGATYSRDDRTT